MNSITQLINYIRKHKVIFIIIMILLFFVPLLIVNILYKWYSGIDFFIAEWSAGDLILYISGFFAFFGTVALGLISVWQTDKANNINKNLLDINEKLEKRAVLPYLSIDSYLKKYQGSVLKQFMINKLNAKEKLNEDSSTSEEVKRIDYLLKEINFIISKDSIRLLADLDKEHKSKVETEFEYIVKDNSIAACIPKNYYDRLRIKNCGIASAILVKCRLYKEGLEENIVFDKTSFPFTLQVGESFDLGLYFEKYEELKDNKYMLELTYDDIYTNHYIHEIPMEILEEGYTIDLDQRPKPNNKKSKE